MANKNSFGGTDVSVLVGQYYEEFASKYKSRILNDRDPVTWVSNEATRADFTKRIDFETEIFRKHFLNKKSLVLDAGCGIGRQAIILARAGFNVTACDMCQTFIDIGKTLADREGLSIEFLRQDIKRLQFQDHYFDYVVFLSTIEHVPENGRKAVLYEVSRVLKDKGIIIIAFPFKNESHGRSGIMMSIVKRPWQVIPASWGFLGRRIGKLKKRGNMKITEEHPFPLPTEKEIAEDLPDNLHIIDRLHTDAHHFLVVQNG